MPAHVVAEPHLSEFSESLFCICLALTLSQKNKKKFKVKSEAKD